MGGRGSKSGLSPNGILPVTPSVPQNASDTRDLQELEKHMAKVGVKVDTASLKNQTFENVKGAAFAIEKIIQEFPQAQGMFNKLQGGNLGSNTFACAYFNGDISLSNHHFSKSASDLEYQYGKGVNSGFHPAGTGKDDITSHEAGHVLEAALIRKMIPGHSFWDKMDQAAAWKKCTIAKNIVSEACKEAKKTPAGEGMKNADLIKGVSGYAMKNRSETLAECVADYSANGANAKPLSIAVWKILKRELG